MVVPGPAARLRSGPGPNPLELHVGAVATPALAARTPGGQLGGGEHVEAGDRVEVPGLAGVDGGAVGGQDDVAVRVRSREALGVRLVDAAWGRHPASVAHAGRRATFHAMSTLGTGPTVFHNPRCSKSRAAMAPAAEPGIDAEEVPYLHPHPDPETPEHPGTRPAAPPP